VNKQQIITHFDRYAAERHIWKLRNRYYYQYLESLCRSYIPDGARVMEIGCGVGDLLASVRPSFGVGVDLSGRMVEHARSNYPHLHFVQGDGEALPFQEAFDYVIVSDLLGHISDIQEFLYRLRGVCAPQTQVLITYFNFVWQPVLTLAESAGMKMPQQQQNWLGMGDIENLLYLCDYEIVDAGVGLPLPVRLPLISDWLNEQLTRSRLTRWLGLAEFFVARPLPETPMRQDLTCSVVIPCRNEVGNIVAAVERTPEIGTHTELIFVDGDSSDGTVEKIEQEIVRWQGVKDIRLIHQLSRQDPNATATDTSADLMLRAGKGDAVRKAFAAARGDVLMILDADLTVPPEELPKFFKTIAQGKAQLINGTRLVYPLEDESTNFPNMVGNKMFSWIFTWLLEQRIKDTLCGTKVLFRSDYLQIAANRSYFGDFDPFGDFDLLFGAARLGLKIVEMPVRYRRRVFGDSKVRVLKHGILLMRMSLIGFGKLKWKKWWRGIRQVLAHE
jgi:ubiquinone/menaquinone biosynthesis C-methylase UbiE/glycosyltransferase involved in cell wall biosynthesis